MTNRPPTAYAELEGRFARLSHVNGARAVLSWDHQAMMPEGGAEARADQLATLAVLAHEMLTDPRHGDLLDRAEGETLDDWQRANLAEMRRQWRHATAVESALVETLSKAVSASEHAWREARPANDFKGFAPKLARVLELVREVAARKAAALGVGPYDALLDEYEPGGSSAAIDAIFDDLEAFLPGFLGEVMELQARRGRAHAPAGPFAVERQRALGERVMRTMGFDFRHGRLDVSRHPFCGGTPDDVRITTRYDEADFTSALMGVIHETGHALYEMGLPRPWRSQPVGQPRGMSLHESQSLLMEMQACRSREFIGFAAPLMREAFGGEGAAWEADNLYRLYTHVEPGFIRVDADEVTYPAHVILRYKLERAMIAGELRVADLPGAWAEGMQRMLGIVPPDDRLGCMQDIHWPDGAWGYFPTYTLGALTAAQLFAAARKADPGIPAAIGRGDFGPLVAWLRANVHGLASSLPTPEILRRATGRPLETLAFKAHLRQRYLA